jgi:GT2 family glycosyltransferase
LTAAPGRHLSVSVVVYQPELEALRSTVRSLRVALDRAREGRMLDDASLWLIDNGSAEPARLGSLVMDALAPSPGWLRLQVLRGHGNVGYGRGHNLAIERAAGAYHLVINPDVRLDPDAVLEALRYIETHAAVGMVTPHAVTESGDRQFLCKRYPSVLVLGLRAFVPAWLRAPFRGRLDRYEMRDATRDAPFTPIPIASGCFMLSRREPLQAVGGFSPEYFLYFEDFDLSLRFSQVADIAYVPAVRIVHAGGLAASKGWRHRRMFVRSAVTFFRRHGWRLW